MNLSLLQIFPLLSMIFILGLGVFVLRNKKNLLGRLFFFVSICFTVWTFGTFRMFLNPDDDGVLFWDRFIYLGVVFMPAVQYHFSIVFTYINRRRKVLLIISYALSLIFLILSRTDYFVDGVFRYRWGVHAEALIFHNFFILYFFSYIGLLLYNFYARYRETNIKIEKYRLKFLVFCFAILNIIGGIGFLPAYRISIYSPVPLLAPLAFSILMSYAIFRYRLMDIRIVFKKAFIYIGLIIFVYSVLWFWILSMPVTAGQSKDRFYFTALLVSVVLVVGIYYTRLVLENIARKYFFFSLYNYQETINDLSKKLTYYTDLNKIIDLIVLTIKKSLQLDKAGIFLIDTSSRRTKYYLTKTLGFRHSFDHGVLESEILIHWLRKNKTILLEDELKMFEDASRVKSKRNEFIRLRDYVKRIDVSLFVPLINNNKLIGVIILGTKISGDAYFKDDLKLLNMLSVQAGIAIQNAILYKQVHEFNKVLQRKVNEQTKSIRLQAEELKAKNINLKKLINVKNDFLRLVNHQLNTPVSIIKNSIFMIKSKGFTVDKGLSFVEEGITRMDEIINDFWQCFSFEDKGIKLNFDTVDIEAIIDDMVLTKSNMSSVKSKRLKIMVEKNLNIPLVYTDFKQITQALSNLLENSIEYTPQGSIVIYFEISKKKLLKIYIKDTGIGIDKNDKKKIFEKFSRGLRAKEHRPGGSGLGLYIAHKIIEASKGVLKLEKTKPGEGSTFSFTLPISEK